MFKLLSFLNNNNLYSYLSLIVVGILSSFGFAPLFIYPLIILYIVTLVYIIEHNDALLPLFQKAWMLSLGHFIGNCYWICYSLVIELEKFWWMIPFALTVLPGFLAIYPALAAFIAKKFVHKGNVLGVIIGFPAIFVICEILRAKILTGFPWNLIGYSLAFNDELIQIASFGGIYILSFVSILIGTILYYAIIHNSLYKLLSAVLIMAAIYIFGYYRLPAFPEFTNKSVKIIQANIKQELKWDEQRKYQEFIKHIHLTKANARVNDIIIWPESAVPYALNQFADLKKFIINNLPANSYLLTGAIQVNMVQNEILNLWTSLYILSTNNHLEHKIYNKTKLVPFGEFIPFRDILPIDKVTPGQIDYSPGSENSYLILDNLIILPLICYEAIFPKHNLNPNVKYDLIINITNDGWFGDSFGPYHHFHMSRLRAVELGLPLVRAANTGISTVIDAYGKIISFTKLNHEAVLESYIPKAIPSTFFAKNLDDNIILAILFKLITIIFIISRRISKNIKI
ncbi:apolipoprotein N-acyltransferase [Rickettsiales endosymbiont of Stachyamoeba lipophora]|uniref:apolipoprotein N-acyltransferase n=1 Tax=Rickettsiales endosymbiont of Stachyamoeba lipophora TaxID=2486578 RepID=UPI0013DE4630|nr:apolipoprotein N-acyltransferase [Rickettsiales endosymbiont of Stachyamoeba lipophora]